MVEVEDRGRAPDAGRREKTLETAEISPAARERPGSFPQQPHPAPEDEKAAAQGSGDDGHTGPQKGLIRRHPFLAALTALIAMAGAAAGYIWWTDYSAYETTDDAFIQARFFTVSPKVSGYIADVPVTDNQEVKAGDVLATIDDRDYRTALASSQAQLAQAEAAIPNIDAQIAAQRAQIGEAQAQIDNAKAAQRFAEEQNERAQRLVKTGAGTVQTAQQTQSALLQAQATTDRAQAALNAAQKQLAALQAQREIAKASIGQAQAARNQAELNVAYTVVRAEQPGRVTQLTAAKGQFVQAGQSLMVIVPDPVWVVANFRETQISDMRPGQPVQIHVDAYPDRTFMGHVDSIQSGSGTAFSLLPAENATGNYVKVVQRVPVKIDFDTPPDVILGPGMSAVPWVRVR